MRPPPLRALASAALLALGACEDVRVEPAQGQILLYVDTDAPLPSASEPVRGPLDAAPLFDRVRIEVYGPRDQQPCVGCVNEFPLDAELLREGRASVGIAPPPRAPGYRARVRMFLAAHLAQQTEPDADGTVDVTVALPEVAEHGVVEVTALLLTDSVGAPVGSLEAPVAPEPGRPSPSRVGSWPAAARVPCASDPRSGEVCVPGGAFWMGGLRGSWSVLPLHDTMRPRLVVLSPFFLDATEVTVRAFRMRAGVGATTWTGGTTGDNVLDFCNYTTEPGPRDDYPVNCVTHGDASTYCTRGGRVLPTEAQYEYAASGLRGHTYAWGEDIPSCTDAVFSRLGWGIFKDSVVLCRQPSPPGGSTKPGSGARDRLPLPTGEVVDLAGNLAEWMRDRWNRSDEPCWSRPGVYVDPVCNSTTTREGTSLRSVRGGDWLVPPGQLARTVRATAPGLRSYVSPEVGFRCARPSPP